MFKFIFFSVDECLNFAEYVYSAIECETFLIVNGISFELLIETNQLDELSDIAEVDVNYLNEYLRAN